jgi:peptidoglycan hydrolase-like protein with peptidoglycan-binding domain
MSRLAVFVVSLTTALALVLVPGGSEAAPSPWAVKAEQRLNALHCDAGRADGRIDTHTRSALVRFQSRAGLRQTGHVNAPTRRRLHAEGAPRCDQRPVPRHSGQGRRIVISQAQNWVWLVGAQGRVLAEGGMVDNPRVLRKGSHTTGSYCGRGARIKLNQSVSGSLWLDDFVRFAPCGVGFHRIPRWKSNGQQMHADWILGTDMATSHGCIRLSRELSREVWEFTHRRTPVRVV